MRVSIVGAGIMGSSAARFLAVRGHDVTVYEQFPLLHTLGSSHGRSRIVRMAYTDSFYTALGLEAYPMWAELQALTKLPIFHETGLFYFGSAVSANMTSQISALRELSIKHTIFEGRDAARVMPRLVLEPGEVGVMTPNAGWVHAQNAVEATIQIAQEYGARIIHQKVNSVSDLDADCILVCAGPWIGEFLQDVSPSPRFASLTDPLPQRGEGDLGPLHSVTLQSFFYVKGNRAGPVWIEDGACNVYGFPSEPDEGSQSYKISAHYPDVPWDPDRIGRPTNPEVGALVCDFARRRFGDPNPEVVESGSCLYTNQPDEDFRIGRLGENGFYASPCSGHGFKFGPWIGRLLADFVEGKRGPEEFPRFGG